MAEKKEYWGDFWLESDPGRRVSGHLTYHPKRAGSLLLDSSLHEGSFGRDGQHYDRIMGKVLGRSCVLLNCFDSGKSTSEAGPGEWEVNARVFVNAMLLVPRQHADSPADRFIAASASFDGLAEFDGRMPFKFGRDDDQAEDAEDTPRGVWSEQVTVVGLDPRAVETEHAKLEFFQGPGSRGGEYRSQTLTSNHSMRVTPREALTLADLIDLYSQARSLIALAMHQDCRFDGPVYLQPTLRPDEDQGDPYMRSYEFHAVWLKGARHRHPPYNRVLSYESLTPEGIARWLALEDECGHVISRLSSLRYTRRIAFEDPPTRSCRRGQPPSCGPAAGRTDQIQNHAEGTRSIRGLPVSTSRARPRRVGARRHQRTGQRRSQQGQTPLQARSRHPTCGVRLLLGARRPASKGRGP